MENGWGGNHYGPEGRYANFFEIGQNRMEFVIEFSQFYPGERKTFHTRIITLPVYAKALMEVLWSSIERYESLFGEIQAALEPNTLRKAPRDAFRGNGSG